MVKISLKKDKAEKFELLIPKEHLSRDFWDEKVIMPEISDALLKIANDIIDTMEINVKIHDIIGNGAIAGYNWHRLSDIDLHIVLDFTEIDENFALVKKMLDQSRINWNKTHNIMIKGHEVELYFQDLNEKHMSSGMWSLMTNTWIKEPTQKDVNIDLATTEKKAEAIICCIQHVESLFGEDDFQTAYDYASKLKKKISNMRKAGLEKEGIYSPENLAFKMLRNSDFLSKLSNLKMKSYDKIFSINESQVKDYFNNSIDPEYLKYGDGGGVGSLLDNQVPAPWGETEELEDKDEVKL